MQDKPEVELSDEASERTWRAPPATQAELEDFVPYLVNRVAAIGQAAQNRRLAEHGVSTVTLRTLSVLHIHDGLTVNEIAARAFAEQSTASRAIDTMVNAGLVERRVSTEDQRRREVGLTAAGQALLDRCWPAMQAHYGVLTDGIDDAELAVFRRVLLRMIDNLRPADS